MFRLFIPLAIIAAACTVLFLPADAFAEDIDIDALDTACTAVDDQPPAD